MRRLVLSVLAAIAGLAASVTLLPAAQAAPPAEGSYIVVLRDSVAGGRLVAEEHRRAHGARVGFVYEAALEGYSARLTASQLGAVRSDPRVAYVEADGVARASGTQTPTPTWGLDRIDSRTIPGDDSYTYAKDGTGVTAYIIDTGIDVDHADFAGAGGARRAVSGYDAIDAGTPADDCNGHGTHVAGTVGGTSYGVAKNVTLVAVRVLGCDGSGSWSGVLAGIDWVSKNHAGPSVANLSLGGGAHSSVDTAVRNMIASGVATAVAAGNGNAAGVAQDACRYTPARVAEAMTIGATDSSDRKASFSNYGKCVDLFAPGVNITSAWFDGATATTATRTISGTSMATPHVAGAAALYLQARPTATAQQVRDAVYNASTKRVVQSSKTTNNHLLYTVGL